MAKIDSLLEEFSREVEQIASTAIINLEDGTPLAGISSNSDADLAVPVAYLSEVSRKGHQASEATNFGQFEEILMNTDSHHMLLRVIPGGRYVHMLVLSKKGNWGIAKILMQKYAQRFAEVLP